MSWFSVALVFLALSENTRCLRIRRDTAGNPKDCNCVPFYLCQDGHVVTDGANVIDIRTLPKVPPPPEVKERGQVCGSMKVCCHDPSETPTVTTPPPSNYHPQCGRRNQDFINTRVLNPFLDKIESKFAEFPYQVAILRQEKPSVNVFVCGGALIDPKFVITGAHCLQNLHVDMMVVRVGEYDTQTTQEPIPHEDVKVAAFEIHPQFNSKNLHNDIAIIILAEDVVLRPNVDTVCLPAPDMKFDDGRCTVTGWGKDAFGKDGQYSRILKKVTVLQVDHKLCEEQLRKTRLSAWFILDESFTCAGGDKVGADACKGDGGGPLTCPYNGLDVLVGVVAWGISCGHENVPGVYVDVARFLPWIQDVVHKNGGEVNALTARKN